MLWNIKYLNFVPSVMQKKRRFFAVMVNFRLTLTEHTDQTVLVAGNWNDRVINNKILRRKIK